MYSFSMISGISFDDIPQKTAALLARQPAAYDDLPGRLRTIFSLLDYTSLDGADNTEKIMQFCRKAEAFHQRGLPWPAAVCVYPPFIATAKQALAGTPVRIATTAAAFPSGQMPLSVKLQEIKYALSEGADEIDVVISRGTFLAGEYNQIFREIDAMRDLARDKTLKVILETGELLNAANIARASEIAIEAGADFIKTSTGKVSPAATEEAVYVMLQVIAGYYRKTGKKIGIKPAGGIADPERALNYCHLVEQELGPEWLTPSLFRIGASRLAEHIAEQIG